MTLRPRLALLAALAVATVVALLLTGEALQPGAASDPAAWWPWLAATDPVTAAVALLRLAGLAGGSWIAVTAGVHLLLVRPDSHRRSWLDRVTPRVVRAAAGASLSVAVLAAPVTAGAGGDPRHQATLRPLDLGAQTSTTTTTTASPTTTTTTTTAPPTTTTIVPPAPAPAPAARPVEAAGDTYVVERADSLWSIAADTLGERLGRPPTEGEVVPFWLRLIALNADRLVVPGNADLIYAGQELILPS